MWVIVLNDGETYTGVGGCKAVYVPSKYDGDAIDEFVKEAYNSSMAVELAITESVASPLTGDIYVPNLVDIEGQ